MNWLPFLVSAVILLFVLFQLYMWISTRQLKGRRVPEAILTADRSAERGRTMYYFYARQCSYCRNMTPIIDRLCEQHCNVVKIDTADQAEIARKFGIRGVPAVLVVDHGVVTDALLGIQPRQRLEKFLGP